jgi:hypothetical protein
LCDDVFDGGFVCFVTSDIVVYLVNTQFDSNNLPRRRWFMPIHWVEPDMIGNAVLGTEGKWHGEQGLGRSMAGHARLDEGSEREKRGGGVGKREHRVR